MENKIVYNVTTYGCNSDPSDLWTPRSKTFVNFDDAYAFFLSVSPDLDDESNIAERYVNSLYNPDDLSADYIQIETRVQSSGYHFGQDNCAKRPLGAVISRNIIHF